MESLGRHLSILLLATVLAAGCGNEYDLVPFGSNVSGSDAPDGGVLDPSPETPVHDLDDGDADDGDDDDGGDGDGIPGGGADCTRTQGYWKNHEDAWPVESLRLGDVTYGKGELLALFGTEPSGDASLVLAHQLIAALLNVAAGAGAPPEVAQALDSADQWMSANADADGRLGYGVHAGDARAQAISLADTLDDYNNGEIGPGHCDGA